MRKSKNILTVLATAFLLNAYAQKGNLNRTEPNIPDILGYKSLVCDFHLHTVFSDGNVWPTVRVDEAWEHGYDVISITDHIEWRKHRKYLPLNYNASNEIARAEGKKQDILVIPGSEITRITPPGHMNAIFVKDVEKIATKRIREVFENNPDTLRLDKYNKDYFEALDAAREQGAFIFWNHPYTTYEDENLGVTRHEHAKVILHDDNKELIEKGYIQGIEVADHSHFWPEAFRLCLKYNLTLLGNSDHHDSHETSNKVFMMKKRNSTLVFAKERTEKDIKEALINRRTAVTYNEKVIGKQEFLEPLFKNALILSKPHFIDENGALLRVKNSSDFVFEISSEDILTGTDFTFLRLEPNSEQIIKVAPDTKEIKVQVNNFIVTPTESLNTTLELIYY